jgi:DNA adenine methylase
MCKPFVKWAGGKRQLVEELRRSRPGEYNRFIEPFIGGGALFFALRPADAFISDINEELINIYTVVRDNVDALIAELKKHERKYKGGDPKEYFYAVRNVDRETGYARWSGVRKAARLIFLNKTCFNGLYRVNSRKQFNTPFGFYVNPAIVDEQNLLACSSALASTEIAAAGFDHVLNIARKDDLVYFDPPYVPLTSTANFTSYTGEGFDLEMQKRLREVCDKLDAKKVKWMLSNSHTEFVLNLYKDKYHIRTVEASRAINCKADKRGKVAEVVVTNYEVSLAGDHEQ